MNKKKKAAFTLAEIMIVLTVVGILTAILLPSAFQATPDENVLKFKKAHATLYKVIAELVNSEQYYKDGDLGIRVSGSVTNTTLCETIADLLSTKSVNCANTTNDAHASYVDARIYGTWVSNMAIFDTNTLDGQCNAVQTSTTGDVIATDGVVYYDPNPAFPFSKPWGGSRLFGPPGATVHIAADTGMDSIYKVFCIDIDGKNKGEAPFGYGIRADGKIMPGVRAKEWLKKSVQEKD